MSKTEKAAASQTTNEAVGSEQSDGPYDPAQAPTEAQYPAFSAAFEHFNCDLFAGVLPPAMLAFAKHPRSLGYYIPDRWHRPDDEKHVGEIALNPEHLASDERDVASTIVHEMVHLWQFAFGNPSRRGHHNAEWASRMDAIGLMPSHTGEPGGRRTGQRMTHYVIEGGAFARAYGKLVKGSLLPFVAGSPVAKGKLESKKPDASKTKYTCASCGLNAWAKPNAE